MESSWARFVSWRFLGLCCGLIGLDVMSLSRGEVMSGVELLKGR